jgi:acetylglutamate kinase
LKVLIKLGGTLLDEPASRHDLALQLSAVSRKHQLVVVHGGGKQMTRFLEERGVKSQFVNGLRVSDEPVIDAITKVIAGSVNKQFVAALMAAGQQAVGLSGLDGGLTEAVQLDPALGFVGSPQKTDPTLLELLIKNGYLPVVACLAGDHKGTIFNVNADQMAVSCAIGFQAERLLFLTDVPGVKDAAGNVIAKLDIAQIDSLIKAGVAYGGMQAKLVSARTAVEGGVAEVVVAPGQHPDVCQRLLAGDLVGTKVYSGSAKATAGHSPKF